MGTEQNNAKVPDTKKAKFVDNRKVGVFFIVVAVIVIGVSLIVRIIDSKMSAEYKQVDGVVSSIETKRTYYARKYRYKVPQGALSPLQLHTYKEFNKQPPYIQVKTR